jgi:hypothetical protein
VQVSELLSMGMWHKAVMDVLAATDVGQFPPKLDGGVTASGQWAEEQELAGSP